MIERIWRASLAPLIAAVVAIAVSSVALLISGNNPVEAFVEMWKTIDSTQSVVIIINTAVPLYISGVAVAIGFKMNLFNIGSNGQYILAALIAGWAGAEVSLPPLLHVPFVFAVAILVGGSWALIAAILNVTRNVNVRTLVNCRNSPRCSWEKMGTLSVLTHAASPPPSRHSYRSSTRSSSSSGSTSRPASRSTASCRSRSPSASATTCY